MTKVNLYLDENIWRLFRIECLQRGISASKEIERLLREELQGSTAKHQGKASG